MPKEIKIEKDNLIRNFNKGESFVKLYDNVKYFSNILYPVEFVVAFSLIEYINTYNILEVDNKYLSLKNISKLIDMNYGTIRRLIPCLIKKNVMQSYYIETHDDQYVKTYIINPSLATKKDFNNKYFDIFINHKLVETNHALYSSAHSERNTSLYIEWVQNSLERDNYTCQCCGSKDNLEVHHILNFSNHKDLRTDLSNSITLCQCCHSPIIVGSFHHTYGTRNNNKIQLEDYLKNYKTYKRGVTNIQE